jgi:hypothetical protein
MYICASEIYRNQCLSNCTIVDVRWPYAFTVGSHPGLGARRLAKSRCLLPRPQLVSLSLITYDTPNIPCCTYLRRRDSNCSTPSRQLAQCQNAYMCYEQALYLYILHSGSNGRDRSLTTLRSTYVDTRWSGVEASLARSSRRCDPASHVCSSIFE